MLRRKGWSLQRHHQARATGLPGRASSRRAACGDSGGDARIMARRYPACAPPQANLEDDVGHEARVVSSSNGGAEEVAEVVKVVVAAPAQPGMDATRQRGSVCQTSPPRPRRTSAACAPHPDTGSCLARRGRTISHVVHTRARTMARGCSPRKPGSDRVCASTREQVAKTRCS